MGEIGVKQILNKKSFIPKNICDNEKYIPTTKYVTITPLQNVQKQIFLSPYFLKGNLRPK